MRQNNRKNIIRAARNPLLLKKPKQIAPRGWHVPLWKEIRRIPDFSDRENALVHFQTYLRSPKRTHKGVKYAVSKDPFVLEVVASHISGLSRPIIIIPVGLSEKAERSIVDHELLEWKKGGVAAHSKKSISSELPGRRRVKKEVLALIKKASKREVQRMRAVVRGPIFKKYIEEYKAKFSRLEKLNAEHKRLGIPLKGRESKRYDALTNFLESKYENKEVIINGEKFKIRFNPLAGYLTLAGKYADYSYIFGDKKGSFYPGLSSLVASGADNLESMSRESAIRKYYSAVRM